MRFLCVALMLQISIADIHGMEREEEASLLNHPSTSSLKKKVYACVCGLIALAGATGSIMLATQSHPHSSAGGLSSCPPVRWNRMGEPCMEGYDQDPFTWAIVECQGKLLGNRSCVPVCDGGSAAEWIPVGWERKEHLRKDLNCSEDLTDVFQYAVCSPKKAAEAEEGFKKYDVPYCKIDTENGTGLVCPHEYFSLDIDFQWYWLYVAHNPQYMEQKCKSLADKARRLGKCKGSFASNEDVPQRRKQPKHKRRS